LLVEPPLQRPFVGGLHDLVPCGTSNKFQAKDSTDTNTESPALRRLSKYTQCQEWPPRQWKQRFDTTLEFPFIDRLLVVAHAKTNTDQNSSFEKYYDYAARLFLMVIFDGLSYFAPRRAERARGFSVGWPQLPMDTARLDSYFKAGRTCDVSCFAQILNDKTFTNKPS